MEKAEDEFLRVGTGVRVLPDCPHTLPSYARTNRGVVVGHTEDGLIMVKFGEDWEFPIPEDCLERYAPPADD